MSIIENVNVIYLKDYDKIEKIGFPTFDVDSELNDKNKVDDEIQDPKINYDFDDETVFV